MSDTYSEKSSLYYAQNYAKGLTALLEYIIVLHILTVVDHFLTVVYIVYSDCYSTRTTTLLEYLDIFLQSVTN